MQFSMILVVVLVPSLVATEKHANESGQCVSREEFQALREQLARSREETAAVRREVDSWQNSTILILKRYLIENPNDVKVEMRQLKDELQQMKQEMREEHITIRNTSLKDDVNAELQLVKDELQQLKQEMREEHITTRNTSLKDDVKVELQLVKDELQQMKQEMREEHITTRNTSLKDDVKVELQLVKDELQQMKQEMREEHITTRNTSLEGIEGCVSLETENFHSLINTAQNNILEELKKLNNQCRFDVGSRQNPAASCKEIPVSPSVSGYYWIGNSSVHARRTYCDMTRRCCNSTGGWMRVVEFNMANPTQNCPQGFRTITSPRRLCGRQSGPGCASTTFPVHGVKYQKVCGRATAYQEDTPDAFYPYYGNRTITIDDTYIDGVSITHGRHPRKHVWSFAAAVDEVHANEWVCPCTKTDEAFTGAVPPFVGQDYFCDTGSRSHYQYNRIFLQDPLWDGSGCGSTSSCCRFNSPPWFCKQLPQPTTDDIELRLCSDQSTSNEDVLIEIVELHVQ